MHLVYPLPPPPKKKKKKFCTAVVPNFSWALQSSQGKSKTKVMQNVWGMNKVHYGLCEDGEFPEETTDESKYNRI